MKCDLHCHSVFSDGTWTPEDIVRYADENDSVIALTDHNTTAGLCRFSAAAKEKNIEYVAGVEFSSDYNKKELHVLALFVDEKYYSLVEETCFDYKIRKEKSNIELIERLNNAGYDISFQQLKENALTGSFNRAVIATELKKKGYVASIDEAFGTILHKKSGFYVPPERKTVYEVIEFIKSINALPVLAHPLVSLDADSLEAVLPSLKEAGLVGLETMYSLYSPEDNEKAEALAQKYGLFRSGGSDFHGLNKPDIEMFTGKGNLKVPYEFYRTLKEYHNSVNL